jgi:hypothetical protein
MADQFSAGDSVVTTRSDPTHHTRLPRYVRGATGTIVETEGEHPIPDNRSRGIGTPAEPVYAVRFAAGDLFEGGEHDVVLALWRSYLQRSGQATDD